MQEIDVEELLAFHPYLISRKFEKLKPLRQVTKRDCRLDLAFETKDGLSIVELKKERLSPEHVSQIVKYCRIWETPAKPLAREHFLIGKFPVDESALLSALKRTKRKINLLYLGKEIPKILMKVGDRYRAYDEATYSANIVEIRI
jgi:hypothetical protein